MVGLKLASRPVADRTEEDVVVLLTLGSRVVIDVSTVEDLVVGPALPGGDAVDVIVRMALPLRAAEAGSALARDASAPLRDLLRDAALLAADAQPRALLGEAPLTLERRGAGEGMGPTLLCATV